MKKTLYPIQALHASLLAKALERNGAAMDASETGCGKTIVAATLAALYRRPTLIVGLKQTLPMWREEMIEQGWPAIGVINYEMLRTGRTPWGSWTKCDGEKMWQWNLPRNALIITDEVQNCQGMRTQNSKMLIAAKPYWNLMLSATAVENPAEMRSMGYILGLHNLRNFMYWAKERGCTPDQWAKLQFNNKPGVLDALHRDIFPEKGSRLTTADLKDHFAETQIITTPLDFGDEIVEIYAQMEAEIAALEEIMTSDSRHPAAEALVAQLRARQKVEFLKVPTMIEMAERFMAEGRGVVLFVNFTETINALVKRLPMAKMIRGGQTVAARRDAQESFMNNTCRLLICNEQAGGVSLNLHDIHGGHPRVSIISPDWDGKKVIQVLGRIHRAGGQTPSQQHVLYAAGTVEERVEKVQRQKIINIGIFNAGVDGRWSIQDHAMLDA